MRTPPPPFHLPQATTPAPPTSLPISTDRPTLDVPGRVAGEVTPLPATLQIPSARVPKPGVAPGVAIREVEGVVGSSSAPALNRALLGSLKELAGEARKALVEGDLATLEARLAQLELAGGSQRAITRVRGLSQLARGDVVGGLRLVRDARRAAANDAEVTRGSLAYAIALGAAGRRDDALLEALGALAIARRGRTAAGDTPGGIACRSLIDRILASPRG